MVVCECDFAEMDIKDSYTLDRESWSLHFAQEDASNEKPKVVHSSHSWSLVASHSLSVSCVSLPQYSA